MERATTSLKRASFCEFSLRRSRVIMTPRRTRRKWGAIALLKLTARLRKPLKSVCSLDLAFSEGPLLRRDSVGAKECTQGFGVRRAGDAAFGEDGSDVLAGRDVKGGMRGMDVRCDTDALDLGDFV